MLVYQRVSPELPSSLNLSDRTVGTGVVGPGASETRGVHKLVDGDGCGAKKNPRSPRVYHHFICIDIDIYIYNMYMIIYIIYI